MARLSAFAVQRAIFVFYGEAIVERIIMELNEYIGYRANTKTPQGVSTGIVTVYAERNNSVALGEYGGDSYPCACEYTNKLSGKTYGFLIVADGVGQASYVHPSLETALTKYCEEHYPNLFENQKEATMLHAFFELLYGEDFFADPDAEDYAIQCFSSLPTNGFFATKSQENWGKYDSTGDPKVGQVELPFYKRDSQSLGSRIVCVGLFYKFRRFFENDTAIELYKADFLKTQIENYLQGELKDNIGKLFSLKDAPNITKKNHYFLCSTVAMWFYITDKNTSKVSALALNCGDARCYISDKKEGVRQISTDDALPDGSMSAFVHYGEAPRNDSTYHDGKFHSAKVEADYPCALFVCSDGVYDTCPLEKEAFLTYGQEPEANDLLFELNMLKALRSCYSLEDFRREIVFNFYGQANRNCQEFNAVGNFSHIKKDDSGTLSGRFFGNNFTDLFVELRKVDNTFLDRFLNYLNANQLPYYQTNNSSVQDKQKEALSDYATGEFKTAVMPILKKEYPNAFAEMKGDGQNTLWGVENCNNELVGFKLGQFVAGAGNLVKMLEKAIKVYQEKQSFPEKKDYPVYDNVLGVDGVSEAIADGFESFVQSLDSTDSSDDENINNYESFIRLFYGNVSKEYKTQKIENRKLPTE